MRVFDVDVAGSLVEDMVPPVVCELLARVMPHLYHTHSKAIITRSHRQVTLSKISITQLFF